MFEIRGDSIIKYLPNIITTLRMIFALMLLFADPFAWLFWIFYFLGGLSDVLDGFVARKYKLQSDFGAKFDSIADAVYLFAVIFVAVKAVRFPIWLYIWIVIILAIRLISYGIGYCKYKTFFTVHTYMNKATGIMLFAFPVLYSLLGIKVSGGAVIVLALASAIEELAITLKAKRLNRNCRTVFLMKERHR